MTAPAHSTSWRVLLGCYAVLSFLLVLPSATLWFGEPFEVLKYNFHYFCGYELSGWTPEDMRTLGRYVQVALFAGLGTIFYLLSTRYSQHFENSKPKDFWLITGAILAIHMVGLPWLNPDVFYGIARGWVDTHYGLEPYRIPIIAIRDASSDPMFTNLDAPLWKNIGNYGPLHHSIAALLSGLSGGNPKIAVFLFKLTNLGFLLGTAALFFRLAKQGNLPARHLTFCFLCNPIVPLVTLAWVHNDIQVAFFILLSACCVFWSRPFLSGLTIGAAIAHKFVALPLLPPLLLYWLVARKWKPGAAFLTLIGTVLVVAYTHSMYEGAWESFVGIYTTGWSPVRSSIYTAVFMLPIAFGIEIPPAGTRWTLNLLFFAAGAAISFLRLLRRDVKPGDLVIVWVWIFMSYFVLAAPAVLEWYFLWSLPLLLLLPTHFRFFAILFSFYLILVPWTLFLPTIMAYSISNVMYAFFLVCVFFLTPWRNLIRGEHVPVPLNEGPESGK